MGAGASGAGDQHAWRTVSRWRWVDPTRDGRWDAWVAPHPEANVFHSSGWARVLSESYGYPLYYGVLEADATAPAPVRGLLPVCEVDSVFTGRRGSCLPFADECAPLQGAAPETADAAGGAGFGARGLEQGDLLAPLLELGRRRRWRYIELHGPGGAQLPGAPSRRFLIHEVDLETSERALSEQLESSHRRNIGRARRWGVEVSWRSDAEAMETYYALHCSTRRRQGVPPQPARFFRAIHRHLVATGHGWVALARRGEELLAGALFLHAGRAAIYKFAAARHEPGGRPSQHHLIVWEAINRYRTEGFARLSFGRTDLHAPGLIRFKRGWGGRERELVYRRIGLRRPPALVRDVAAGGTGLSRRVFRAMPVPLLRLCGRLLYRHLG